MKHNTFANFETRLLAGHALEKSARFEAAFPNFAQFLAQNRALTHSFRSNESFFN
jgi:hypothetical protein